jgi:phage-related protein
VMKPMGEVMTSMGVGEMSTGRLTMLLRNLGTAVGYVAGIMAVGVVAVGALAYGLWILVDGVAQGGTWIVKGLLTIIDDMAWFAANFTRLGSDAMSGLWEGMKSGMRWIVTAIPNEIAKIPQAVRDALGIHSPSLVMANLVGQPMAAGVYQGFSQGIQPEAYGSILRSSMGPANVNGASAGGPGLVLSLAINVTAPNASDPEAFGRGVARGAEAEFTLMLERAAQSLGIGPTPVAA